MLGLTRRDGGSSSRRRPLHPATAARRRLRRRIILAVLAAMVVMPLFVQWHVATPAPAVPNHAAVGLPPQVALDMLPSPDLRRPALQETERGS